MSESASEHFKYHEESLTRRAEQDYGFYVLRALQQNTNTQAKDELKISEARQALEEIGRKNFWSKAQVADWAASIEENIKARVANETCPPIRRPVALPDSAIVQDGLIITPLDIAGPNSAAGNESYETAQITQKGEQVRGLIERLGIEYRKFTESEEAIKKSRIMRKSPYQEYVLLEAHKLVLVCDEASNRTFIVHNFPCDENISEAPLKLVDKQELENRNEIDVDYFDDYLDDVAAWTRMLEMTLNDEAGESLQWKSVRKTAEELGVTDGFVVTLLEISDEAHPDLKEQYVKINKKYSDQERVVCQITKKGREILKNILANREQAPEGSKTTDQICMEIFKELGGSDKFGIPEAEAVAALKKSVHYELNYNPHLKKKRQRMETSKLKKNLISNEDAALVVKRVVEKKKADLQKPLRPENFLTNSIGAMADRILKESKMLLETPAETSKKDGVVNSENDSDDSTDTQGTLVTEEDNETKTTRNEVRRLLNKCIDGQIKHSIALFPYNPETKMGNYGDFRESILGTVDTQVTQELADQLVAFVLERIKANNELPHFGVEHKTFVDTLKEYADNRPNCPFNQVELYQHLYKKFRLKSNDFPAGESRNIGKAVLRSLVYNSWDRIPTVSLNKEEEAVLWAEIDAIVQEEQAVPARAETDVLRSDLVKEIYEQLKKEGLGFEENTVLKKLNQEIERLPEATRQMCGNKRIAENRLIRGYFLTDEVAKKMREELLQHYRNQTVPKRSERKAKGSH